MGGQFGQGRIIYIWLKWLFELVDMDLEDTDQKLISSNIPHTVLEEAISKYGNKADIWARRNPESYRRISGNTTGLRQIVSFQTN